MTRADNSAHGVECLRPVLGDIMATDVHGCLGGVERGQQCVVRVRCAVAGLVRYVKVFSAS